MKMKKFILLLFVFMSAQFCDAQIRQGIYRVFSWQVIAKGEIIDDGLFEENHSTFDMTDNLMKLSVERFPAYVFVCSKWEKTKDNIWTMPVTDYKSGLELLVMCQPIKIEGVDDEFWRLSLCFDEDYIESFTLIPLSEISD